MHAAEICGGHQLRDQQPCSIDILPHSTHQHVCCMPLDLSVSHAHVVESHSSDLQMVPQSCIVCISAPPAPPALPSRSPLGAISTQSASHSPDSSHPLARGKENRPAGWCAAAATGKLQQPTSLVSHCQLGKHLDKGGHAPEQRMLGPASAGLLIGTLVGSRRGAAAGQAELRLQVGAMLPAALASACGGAAVCLCMKGRPW